MDFSKVLIVHKLHLVKKLINTIFNSFKCGIYTVQYFVNVF